MHIVLTCILPSLPTTQGIQSQLDKLILAFKVAKWDVKARAEKDVQQMADQRKALVAGGCTTCVLVV